jgi:hypothetical protein
MEDSHDIHDYIRSAQALLRDAYKRIQKRVTEDSGTAGDQGEEDWADVLRKWLPSYFHVVTKGRILTTSGESSGQLDVLVLSPSYPPVLRDQKYYLAGGVVAAFQCKLTLTAADVKETVKRCSLLRRMLPAQLGTPYKELHPPIYYGLLAHSHSWKGTKSKPLQNIENALWEADKEHVKHPNEQLGVICVADLATWHSAKTTFIGPYLPQYTAAMAELYGTDGRAVSSYVRHSNSPKEDLDREPQEAYFSPIGPFLAGLYSKLAWDFVDMRKLDQYLRSTNVYGSGAGDGRLWNISIYSEPIRERIQRGRLSNGAFFDEWSFVFT